jgi:hypothetical protein
MKTAGKEDLKAADRYLCHLQDGGHFGEPESSLQVHEAISLSEIYPKETIKN